MNGPAADSAEIAMSWMKLEEQHMFELLFAGEYWLEIGESRETTQHDILSHPETTAKIKHPVMPAITKAH